jgi:hypothetical protein
MDFAQAWAAFAVTDYVAVSDGSPMPSLIGGLPWRCWRSHNFVGRVIAKIDGAPGHRQISLELTPQGSAITSYCIHESGGHSFTASDADAFANDIFVV